MAFSRNCPSLHSQQQGAIFTMTHVQSDKLLGLAWRPSCLEPFLFQTPCQ